jgi:hypothetical protein
MDAPDLTEAEAEELAKEILGADDAERDTAALAESILGDE